MFDIGMLELLVIGVVALIVVGPKDLPGMFRTLGKYTGKARAMAREFQRSMESAADEAGVSDITEGLKDATSLKNMGLEGVSDAAKAFADKDFAHPSPSKAAASVGAETAEAAADKVAKAATAAKPAVKKSAAKKPAAKASAKTATKAAPKAAAKAPAAKKPAAKKTAPKKTPKADA